MTDYRDLFAKRIAMLERMRQAPERVAEAKAYYAARPAEWISDWVDTYDPRARAVGGLAYRPFVLYPRQVELVEFVQNLVESECAGLIEKSRDMGATWTLSAWSVHQLLFNPGVSIGWGSRKEILVDRLGDPDSIFEKMRLLIRLLPPEFLPEAFDEGKHMSHMRILNPLNGASITGEAGDNIGRGGRKLVTIIDEAAHLERPELVEAALADTTRVRIDISSVCGVGNVFHRKRQAGKVWDHGEMDRECANVFIMDWRQHPEKDEEWYRAREAKAEREGMIHIFRQEVDRDYTAAVADQLIEAKWIRAAVDLHHKFPELADGGYLAGLDVADEGGDMNALVIRKGLTLVHADHWGRGDTGQTTRRAVKALEVYSPVEIMYDPIGVGAGVKAESNRLIEEDLMPKGVFLVPWNAGAAPIDPEEPVIPDDPESVTNLEHFLNMKAQGWWNMRHRLEKTWRVVEEGIHYDPEELISIDGESLGPMLYQLEEELCQARTDQTPTMKQKIRKKEEGQRSPNVADAMIMCYMPVEGPMAYTRAVKGNII